MTRAACPHEVDVVDAIVAGRYPSRVDAGLRAHVEACPTCADIAFVAPTLRDDYLAMIADVQVPLAGQVWWRAAVRARLDTAQTAARPITWMHGLVGAGVAGLLAALIGMVWQSLAGSAAWAAALTHVDVGGAELAALVVRFLEPALPLAITIALVLVIAPVAVYVALSDD